MLEGAFFFFPFPNNVAQNINLQGWQRTCLGSTVSMRTKKGYNYQTWAETTCLLKRTGRGACKAQVCSHHCHLVVLNKNCSKIKKPELFQEWNM